MCVTALSSSVSVAFYPTYFSLTPILACGSGCWASRNRDGDWHSYTHLSSKREFSESMKPRALQMEDILRGRADPWCRVCGNYQRFSEHIPGPAHFRMLTDNFIKDGVRVADVRECLWNEYELNGEVYRFNELDGSIERMKSQRYPPQVQPMPGGTSFPKSFQVKLEISHHETFCHSPTSIQHPIHNLFR